MNGFDGEKVGRERGRGGARVSGRKGEGEIGKERELEGKSEGERGRGSVCVRREGERYVRSWQLDEREQGHRGKGRRLFFLWGGERR